MIARVLAALALTATAAHAKPVILDCRGDDQRWVGEVTIDEAAGVFKRGAVPFRIVHSDDAFIVAEEDNGRRGTYSLMIERATGRFSMATVGLFCHDVQCETPFLWGETFVGQCRLAIPRY